MDQLILTYRKRYGMSPLVVRSPGDLACSLAGATVITHAKCYLYLVSGCRTCIECIARVRHNGKWIDAGRHAEVRTPMIDFYTTAKTGVPGIPDSVKRLAKPARAAHRPPPSHSRGYTPPTAAQQADAMLERLKKNVEKQELAKAKAKAKAEAHQVVQVEPVKVVKKTKRPQKSSWIDKCVVCKVRKPIRAWCICFDCSEKK